jgi:AraC-like DNA-binding protein
MGNDSIHQTSSHIYILCIDYSPISEGKPCPVTLYYTDPIPDFVDASPLITPQGNLLLTGGTGKKENPSHNFYPLDNVFLFHFGSDEFVASSFFISTPWLLGTLLLITAAIICFYFYYRRQAKQKQTVDENEAKAPKTLDSKDVANAELMQRIHHLVVEEKQFLNSDLTASGLAIELGTHRNNISACVNLIKGCNFTQYVNGYRIEYAKQLIRQHPEMKLYNVGYESGFTNETSFYRTFKALTGKTPSEWKATID